jgi:hypothetical protein
MVAVIPPIIAATVAFFSMAVAVIAATWPFILIGAAIVGVIYLVWELIESIMALGADFMNFGSMIVTSIWEGIQSGWSWLADQFTSLIGDLPGGKYILQALGISANVEGAGVVSAPTASVASAAVSPLGVMSGETKTPFAGATDTYSEKNTTTEKLSNIKLHIDGKELKSWVDKEDRDEDSRN